MFVQFVGLLISLGGIVFLAGRWLVTKSHLYEPDGTPIYQKAKNCIAWRAGDAIAAEKRHKELAESLKTMNETLAGAVVQLTAIDKSRAVLSNEVSHLRKDLNGAVAP